MKRSTATYCLGVKFTLTVTSLHKALRRCPWHCVLDSHCNTSRGR